ncbi:MAG: hypothetical protein NC548_10835 [Lachnospiraceae bacterium]|nr:hypothetical protein [Lachnospiraceae bacterium]
MSDIKNEKVNYKTVLMSALVSLLMVVIGVCICICVVINKTKDDETVSVQDVEYEAGDVLPSGAVASDEQGGTASITLADGTVLEYNIPSAHYALHDDYLNLVATAYGISTPVVSDNLVVTGNENNVYSSTDAITATTFADIYNIYAQIYGDAWSDVEMSELYPPVYEYIQSGEVPETPYLNYAINEVDTIEKDGVTYRVFEQDYDTTYTQAAEGDTGEVEEVTEHVHQLAAYSDTEDVVEIIVDVESNNTKDAVKLLKEFIGV